ncbi:MAG: MATE family efflux transporter [Acidobacteriota bacterium]|nr:MATE family efflux transporter [Acidobacteriota bacterium]
MTAPTPRAGIRAMLRIAIPLAFAELGWMSMSLVDNIMVGRLPDSAAAIGAASVGSALFYAFAIFALGLMSGLDTLVSHAHGAGNEHEAHCTLGSGLALALCIAPLGVACILALTPLLGVLGVAPQIRQPAIQFTRTLVWSLPLLLLYTTFRRYLQGIHYVKPVTFGLVSSNLVNVLGNWVLIYGHWGAPRLGIVGSALSTVIARLYLAAFLGFVLYRRDPAAFHDLRPDPVRFVRLFRLGLPAALAIGFEVGVFNTSTALAAKFDAISLAAHTIALNAASVTYMIPLGISSAAAVSVGKALGAGDRPSAARAGWTALGLATLFQIGAAAAFVLLPVAIAHVYTPDGAVISFAVKLLAIAAVFQIFDGLQTVATGALRGLGNTRTPMIWNLVCYWVIGLPLGCWLGFVLHWGVAGLWYGLCLALMLIGTGLLTAWHKSTKRFLE